MTTVRTDVFKLGDKFATLLGDEVKVGEAAPEFTSVVPGWGRVNPRRQRSVEDVKQTRPQFLRSRFVTGTN
jgi:hypothetical protein